MPLRGLEALREFDARLPSLLAEVESGDPAKAVDHLLRAHRAAMEAYAADLAALFAWWIEAGNRPPHRFLAQKVEAGLSAALLGAYIPPTVELHLATDEPAGEAPGLRVIREPHAPPKGSRARLVAGRAPGEAGVYDWTSKEGALLLATALATRDASRAAKILIALPGETQAQALLSLARMVLPNSEAMSGLPRPVVELLVGEANLRLSGVEHATAIMNAMPTPEAETVLASIEREAPDVAARLREGRFVFENLVWADDRGLQNLMREVEGTQVALALKSSSEELREKLLRNVSRNQRMMILEMMQCMGPVRLADVEAVQEHITTVAKGLREQGDLFVLRPGERLIE